MFNYESIGVENLDTMSMVGRVSVGEHKISLHIRHNYISCSPRGFRDKAF